MPARPFARLSIQWKLPLVVGALLIALTAVLAVGAYQRVVVLTLAAESERLPRVMGQLVGNLHGSFRQTQRRLHLRTSESALHTFLQGRNAADETAALNVATAAVSGRDTASIGIEIWDSTGKTIASKGLATGTQQQLSARDVLTVNFGDDSATVGKLQAVGDTLFYPTIATVTTNGSRVGYLVIWRRLTANPGSQKATADLLGPNAQLFIGSPGGAWTDQVNSVAPPPFDVSAIKGLARYVRAGAGAQFATAVEVPGSPWQILVEIPAASLLAGPRRFLTEIVAIAAVLVLLGLIITWGLSRRITRPLLAMTAALDARGAGQPLAPVRVRREDEIGRLATAFSEMAAEVGHESAARNASEQQWRQLFDNSPLPMFIYDIETLQFLAVNEATELQYGYHRAELLTKDVTMLMARADLPNAIESIDRIRKGGGHTRDWHHQKRDGTVIDVTAHSHPLTFGDRAARLVLVEDVTARNSLEAQLRQAQKMEAIGQLAAGVAHDFNNVLTVVSGYAELLQETFESADRRREDVSEILLASGRATTLTKQLLAFGRRQVLQPVVLDLNETVSATEKMLSRLLGANIEAVWLLAPDLHAVKLDRGQMEQVVLNLAVNARDAMETGGKLTVETRNVTLDESAARARSLPAAGEYVLLSVSDTGVGMSREVQAHVFEPFYTTKAQGKGTGLGLATVYGIVTQSGGSVLVYSEPGIGTTFKLYFPATTDLANVTTEHAIALPRPRSATILLVEDEAPVRRFAATALTRAGYNVLEAENGAQAMQIVETLDTPPDLLLTDVIMPGISGRELSNLMVQVAPDLKVVFMSGYSGEAVVRHGVLPRGIALLEKPFSTSALLSKVGEALPGAA